jgi:hypothetical protein
MENGVIWVQNGLQSFEKENGLNKKDDGDFYKNFNDFIKYYVTMGLDKIHPDY